VAAAAQQSGAEPAEEKEAGKGGGRKKLLLLAAPALLAAVVGGLWFTGILPRMLGMEHAASKEDSKPAVPIFVDLPEMVANLNGSNHRPSYLKLVARLEVAKAEDAERAKQAMPRLQDLFQTYLREMRPEELRGSAGTYRLREELIARANVVMAPGRAVNVLFIQLLVQ
jgi:flagellar FliL protein